MDLIDTHVHLLHPERFTYEWCANVPELKRAFRIDDYRAAAVEVRGMRVTSMLFMEADVPVAQQEDETSFFARIADRDRGTPALSAVIAGAWPESPAFPTRLDALVRDARVRGIRRVLHPMPDDFATSPRFAENLRRLAKPGLTFDLCLRPHLLPVATALAAQCPDTQFVLDHCGVPDIAGGKFEFWSDLVQGLAAQSNVVCKFSGLASCCQAGRPLTPQVAPYFERCLECFGPSRMMWGSDWPVCNLGFDLAAWIETTADLLGKLSADEQAEIATRTAERIYRLG